MPTVNENDILRIIDIMLIVLIMTKYNKNKQGVKQYNSVTSFCTQPNGINQSQLSTKFLAGKY